MNAILSFEKQQTIKPVSINNKEICMNDLAILKQTAQTMSSREIAQLCQKPHDNVLKLIRSLIDGGIVKSTTPHQYMHPQNGQWYTVSIHAPVWGATLYSQS